MSVDTNLAMLSSPTRDSSDDSLNEKKPTFVGLASEEEDIKVMQG
jgi:hypothetical protein